MRKFWQLPWGYKESILVHISFIGTGCLLEITLPHSSFHIPAQPFNAFIGLGSILLLIGLHLFREKIYITQWLASIPFSLTSICSLLILCLFAALLPQQESAPFVYAKIGFHRVTSSWPFALSLCLFLASLGLVTLKHLTVKDFRKNIGFIANHLGLWLTITAAVLGTGDLKRTLVSVHKGHTVWEGEFEGVPHLLPLPFAIKLHDFEIEEFAPQLTLVNSETQKISGTKDNVMISVERSKNFSLGDWTFEVLEYLSRSAWVEDRYVPIEDFGAVPAVHIRANNTHTHQSAEDWVSCGSMRYPARNLFLDDQVSLAMLTPQVESYRSEVTVYFQTGEKFENVIIEVNKPFHKNGWSIYQASYDKEMGRWSPTSVFEAVQDPWLPVVYTGIGLLLLGSVLLVERKCRKW